MTGAPPPAHRPDRGKLTEALSDLVSDVKQQRKADRRDRTVEHQKKLARARRKYVWLVLALMAFAASLVYAIPRWNAPYAAPTGIAADHHARETLFLAAQMVEAFAERNGRVPDNLEEIGVPFPGVSYQAGPGTWEMTVSWEGGAVTLRRGQDLRAFRAGR